MRIFTWKHRALVAAITLASIIVFGLIGYVVGRNFGQEGAATVVAVCLSFPVTQFLIAKTLRKDTKKTIDSV